MDCSVLSLYAWLGCSLRRRGLRVLLLILLSPVFFLAGMLVSAAPAWVGLIPLPPLLHGNARLFLPEAGAGEVLYAGLVSLAWVFLTGRAGVRKLVRDLTESEREV